MVKRIRKGLFGSITKYKPIWCNHADWLIFKALAARDNRTMIEMLHEMIHVYITCKEQNHAKQIESLDEKVIILAAELRKYYDRFGRLPV